MARAFADTARGRGVFERLENRIAKSVGGCRGEIRDLVIQYLSVREQPCRDDRTSGTQVLINLQRRVGPTAARRHEDVGRVEEFRDLLRRSLPRKYHNVGDPRCPCLLFCCLYLIRQPPRQHEPHVRPAAFHMGRSGEQQLESLIRLECPRVQNHRRGIRQVQRRSDPSAGSGDGRIA
jgi:hypothetical protein